MKVLVTNLSGNVGKSTLAHHLLSPRMNDAKVISVESINSDGTEDETIRGKQFGEVLEVLPIYDDLIVDVGASNIEDLLKMMRQYRGSHEDFDYFVIPTTKEAKQMRDTISTIDALSELKVPAKKIRLVFNMVEPEDNVEQIFAGLFAYQEHEKKFVINSNAVLYNNAVFTKLKESNKTIKEVLSDETDHKALLAQATTTADKVELSRQISLKRLCPGVIEELDYVFKVLFK